MKLGGENLHLTRGKDLSTGVRYMNSKKSNFQTKKVSFNGKEMTLYSLDGVTWSTRPDELTAIIERHSTEQAAYSSDLKGEEREKIEKVKPKHKKFNRVHNDDELDEIIEEDAVEDMDEDIPLEDLPVDDEVDEAPVSKAKKESAVKAGKEKAVPSKGKKIEKAADKPAKVVAPKAPAKKDTKPSKAPKAKAAPKPAKGKKPAPAKSKKK